MSVKKSVGSGIKNVKPLFCTYAGFPDRHIEACGASVTHFLVSYQLLKGGTIQLLALHERMSQPVELIVVLTQHP